MANEEIQNEKIFSILEDTLYELNDAKQSFCPQCFHYGYRATIAGGWDCKGYPLLRRCKNHRCNGEWEYKTLTPDYAKTFIESQVEKMKRADAADE